MSRNVQSVSGFSLWLWVGPGCASVTPCAPIWATFGVGMGVRLGRARNGLRFEYLFETNYARGSKPRCSTFCCGLWLRFRRLPRRL